MGVCEGGRSGEEGEMKDEDSMGGRKSVRG